jgi:DNA-binding response OmpR family regulator
MRLFPYLKLLMRGKWGMFKIKKRLLLVKSDNEMHSHLQHYLSSHYHVTCVTSSKKIADILLKNLVDLIMLPIASASRHLLCLLEWFASSYPQIHVMVIVDGKWANEDGRIAILEKGVVDILIKPFHPKELSLRIDNFFSLQQGTYSTCYQLGDLTLQLINNCVFKAGKKITLTFLETKLLQLLYLNVGEVVTREVIAQQLYGLEYHPLNRSIDIHINKIRKKIGDNSSEPHYIWTIRGRGYCLKSSFFIRENMPALPLSTCFNVTKYGLQGSHTRRLE